MPFPCHCLDPRLCRSHHWHCRVRYHVPTMHEEGTILQSNLWPNFCKVMSLPSLISSRKSVWWYAQALQGASRHIRGQSSSAGCNLPKYNSRIGAIKVIAFQEEDASEALESALTGLRLLNTYYAEHVQQMRENRSLHSDTEGIAYPVGQVT